MRTYVINENDPKGRSITCLVCMMTSYNPHDILNLYCGHCHMFHSDMVYA